MGQFRFIFSSTVLVGINHYVTAADMNGDKKVDVISTNTFDNNLIVPTNNGSGVFSSNITYCVGYNPICWLRLT